MSDDPSYMVDWSYNTAAALHAEHERSPLPDWDEIRASGVRAGIEDFEALDNWQRAETERRAIEEACIPRLLSGECKIRLTADTPWSMEAMIGRWLDAEHCIEFVELHVDGDGEYRLVLHDHCGASRTFEGLEVDVLDPECTLVPVLGKKA